jgi:hypothetical protein
VCWVRNELWASHIRSRGAKYTTGLSMGLSSIGLFVFSTESRSSPWIPELPIEKIPIGCLSCGKAARRDANNLVPYGDDVIIH